MDSKEYQEIFEQASALMVVVDKDFKVLAASDGFLNMTRNKRQDIIDRYIFDVFPKSLPHIEAVLVNTMRSSFNKVLKDKVPETSPVVRYDIPIPGSEDDYEVMYWKVINTPILNGENNVKYIKQRYVDVTDSEELSAQLEIEKRNLDEYKTAEEYINNVLKRTPTPICMLKGPEHVFEMANKEFLRLVADRDIIGKPVREAMPEIEGQGFFEILDEVYKTKKSFTGNEVSISFNYDNGKSVDAYIDFVYQVLDDINEEKGGIFVLGVDVTDQVVARKKAEDSKYQYRMLIEQSPVATAVYTEPNNLVKYANDKMLDYWDKDKTIMGVPLYEAVPELKEQPFLKDIDGVFATGETHSGIEEKTELIRNGKRQTYYFNYTYQALRNREGEIYGVQNVVIDVTEQVLARREVEENEYHYRTMIEESTIATAIFRGPDIIVEYANDRILEIWDKDKSIFGKPLRDVLPELKDQPFLKYLENVYKTGNTQTGIEEKAELFVDGKLQTFYFNYTYKALRDREGDIYGIQNIAIDVTEQVLAKKELEESEYKYRSLIEESPIPTAIFIGPEIIVEFANDKMLEIWDADDSVFGMPLIDVQPELKGQPFIDYLNHVYTTGESWSGAEEKAQLRRGGKLQTIYFNFTYKALYDKEGDIYGIQCMAIDVTKQVLAKRKLQENERTLRQLLDSMPQKISHTDEKGNVVFFNQKWMEETGYTLAELQDNGWIETIHPDDFPLMKENWVNAVESGSALEVECRIKHKDLGYRWHLTRSVPINDKNGEVIMWVASNTDIHEQKKQKEILEKAVLDRTRELKQANNKLILQNEEKERQKKELLVANQELESFAYISSHDLQEPLRKIQIFADRIREKENQHLSKRGNDYFMRMQDAAERMRILINDLLSFSRVKNDEGKFVKTDLNKLVEEVKTDLFEIIEEKNATIEVVESCEAHIIAFQFRQLMKNLISNALKFSKPGFPPNVVIKCKIDKGINLNSNNTLRPKEKYCHISVEDNGIGFDPRYSNRIFEVFQRLHNRDEYAGTGIGLAIVKKIVDNHNGIITASSKPGEGTIFDIYIPVDQE